MKILYVGADLFRAGDKPAGARKPTLNFSICFANARERKSSAQNQ
jgi:hypothetical protein